MADRNPLESSSTMASNAVPPDTDHARQADEAENAGYEENLNVVNDPDVLLSQTSDTLEKQNLATNVAAVTVPHARPVPVIVTTRGSGAGFQSEVNFVSSTAANPSTPSKAYSDSKFNLDADKLPNSVAYIGRSLPPEVDVNHTTATLTFVFRLDSLVDDEYFLDSTSDEKLRNAFNASLDGNGFLRSDEAEPTNNAPAITNQQKMRSHGSAMHMLSVNDGSKRSASMANSNKPDIVSNSGRRSVSVAQKFGDLAFLSHEGLLKPEATVHLEYELLPVPVGPPASAGLFPHGGVYGGNGRDSALNTSGGGGLPRRGSDAPAAGGFVSGFPPRDAIKTRNCSVDIISFGHIAKIYAYAASHTPFNVPLTRFSLQPSMSSTSPAAAAGNGRLPTQQFGGASSLGVGGSSAGEFLTKAVFAWREKGCTLIAWTIEHSLHVTTDDLKQLRTHQCEVRVWTDKEKLNVRTKTELNRGKKALFESMISPSATTGMASNVNVNAKPGGAKESASGHQMSILGVADVVAGRPSSAFEDWSAVEQRFVSSFQCRRFAEAAFAHYCASLPKFARSSVTPLIPLERPKNVRINAEDKKRHHGDDAEKEVKAGAGNKTKRSSTGASSQHDDGGKTRKSKSPAANTSSGGGKGGKQQQTTDVVSSIRLNMAKFFSHCRSHVVRMTPTNSVAPELNPPSASRQQQPQPGRGHPPAQSGAGDTPVYDLLFQVTLIEPLLNDFQNQSLIPFVLTVECVKNMPDTPNDFATLRDSCTPAYIQYQLFADKDDTAPAAAATAEPVHQSSPAVRQKRNTIIDDTYVVLLGLKDKEKMKECLLGPPLEIAVHDRDMLGRKPQTNSFGVAQFDLSVLLQSNRMSNKNEILRISSPIHANIPGYNDWTKLVGKTELRENVAAGGAVPLPGVFEEGDDAGRASNGAPLAAGGGGRGARLTVGGNARNRGGNAKTGSTRGPSTHGPNSGGGHTKHDQQRLTDALSDSNNPDGSPASPGSGQAIQLLPAGLYLESGASVKINLSVGWPLQELVLYGPPTHTCIFDRIIIKCEYNGARNLRMVQQIDTFVTKYNIHSLHIDAESKNYEVQQALLKSFVLASPENLQQLKSQTTGDSLLSTSGAVGGQLHSAAKTKSSAQLVYHSGQDSKKKSNKTTTTSTIAENERESAVSKAAESSADGFDAATPAAQNIRMASEDVITGFSLHDSHVHLLVLEARCDGASRPLREFIGQLLSENLTAEASPSTTKAAKKRSVKKLASQADSPTTVRKHADDVLILYDSRLRHSRRLYSAFGAQLEQVVVKRSLAKLMKEPVLYLTHSVPTLALSTLYRLYQLLTSCDVPRDAVQRGLFPSAEGWRQFKLHFCQLHISQPTASGDKPAVHLDVATDKREIEHSTTANAHPDGKLQQNVDDGNTHIMRTDAAPKVDSKKSVLKHNNDGDYLNKTASKILINAEDSGQKSVIPTASQLLLRQRRATGAAIAPHATMKKPLLKFKRRRNSRLRKNFVLLNVARLRKLERSDHIVRKRRQIEKMKPKRMPDHPLFHNKNGEQLAHYALYALQPMRTVRRLLRARMHKMNPRALYGWSLEEKKPCSGDAHGKTIDYKIDRKVLRPFILSCPSEVIQKMLDAEARSACYQRIFIKHKSDDEVAATEGTADRLELEQIC